MIGKLQGIVDFLDDDSVILMVGGVGYKVYVPGAVASRQSPVGVRGNAPELTTLWIETVVREDSIRLFGFESRAQQDLFNKLTGVSGVGPKLGMAILGAFNTDTLLTAIATGDVKTITAAPGVGKKVAEKIVLELKGKSVGAYGIRPETDGSGIVGVCHTPLQDLLSALESLGYRRTDTVEMAQKLVRENPDADIGTLVRLALKEISGSKI